MRQPIIVTRADGSESAYPSIRAVLIGLKLHPPSIHRALKHRRPMNKGPYRGWSFRYADSPVPEPEVRQPAPTPEEYAKYPSSRYEARQNGATHYFTGFPCKHGHIALRKTQGVCVECMRDSWEKAKVTRKGYFEEYRKRKLGSSSTGVEITPVQPVQTAPNPTYKELIEQARVKRA